MLNFLRPLPTGDAWWQDGQIKEEEEENICTYFRDPQMTHILILYKYEVNIVNTPEVCCEKYIQRPNSWT
jgi:hypothetical protein